jgi:hypothetical protein
VIAPGTPEGTYRPGKPGRVLRGLAQDVHDLPVPPGEFLFGEGSLRRSLDETVEVLEPVANGPFHLHVSPYLDVF